MRKLILCLALVGLETWCAPSPRSHYLFFPDYLPALTRQIQPQNLIAFDEGMSIIRASEEDIDRLSEIVHHEVGGCGGFIDVTPEVVSGISPQTILIQHAALKLKRNHGPVLPRVAGKIEIERLIANASDVRFWKFLADLTAFPDRSAKTAEGVKAANWLKDTATQIAGGRLGFKAELVATGTMYQQPSVVVTIPGTDPSLPAVGIGAHMDTFGDQKPGADDDGSGTAVVMEALNTIASSWARFKHTIYFMWYSAEERGLVGSSYVVKKFKADKIAMKNVIHFDMVGYKASGDAQDIYVITDNTNPALTTQLKQLITMYTNAKVGETKCGYSCSDHANWTNGGIPTVYPFESSFSRMNSSIHSGGDKMDILDKAHAFRFAQVALAFLAENAVLDPGSLRSCPKNQCAELVPNHSVH